MLADEVDFIGQKWLPVLRQAGYDYVELPLAQIMDFSEETFCALLEELKTLGIPCEACNNFFPKEVRLTGETVCFDQIQTYVEHAVSRAVRLGAKVIVFGSSGAKNVPEGFDPAMAFEQVVQVLRLVSEAVAPYGIQIAIEPLNRQESNLIVNLKEGIELVEAVARAPIRLLVDYYHFNLEKDTTEMLVSAMPYLVHAHFANPAGRTIPTAIDGGQRYFLSCLQERGYPGRLSVEAFSDDPVKELQDFLVQLKNSR